MKKTNVSILRSVIIVLAVSCVAMMGASPLFAAVVYEDSLVGYWDFDEGSGATADDVAGTNDGTLVNGPDWTTGQYGGALSFDGVNDYVDCENDVSLQPANTVSVASWVYAKDSNTYRTIAQYGKDAGQSYGININVFNDNPNKAQFAFYNGDWRRVDDVDDLPLNVWTHITGIYNGTALKIYVNGILKNTTAYTGSFDYTSVDGFHIGSYYQTIPVGMGNFFNGTIDDVAIWNRALNTDEVSSIYDVGVQGFEGILNGVTTTFGDLGYTSVQIKQLTDLYAAKTSEPIPIGNVNWTYNENPILPGEPVDATIGDTWTYDGKYYIKLGSGLEGDPLGAGGSVPEIPVGIMPFISMLLAFGAKVVYAGKVKESSLATFARLRESRVDGERWIVNGE
ncbi:MAG: LamG domain-containing protein [Candidatus Omnitrophota bacterium]